VSTKKARPRLTARTTFTQVYVDPSNRALAEREREERLGRETTKWIASKTYSDTNHMNTIIWDESDLE
jgi:hypothetical protein